MLRAASGVRWTVETGGVLVFTAQQVRMLGYPEAAVWDLAVRGQDEASVARKLALISGWTPEKAAEFTGEKLRSWREEGLLDQVEGNG